jgi:ParB family chromosome partitioning protein
MRRGLGRGLDSLLPKVERGAQQLPVSELIPSPLQPRKDMDPEALAELSASIAQKGVLQPLLVRFQDGRHEIVAGERRYRAAMAAGLTVVPVIIRELTDQETLEIAIIENLQREDLNVVDEALAFRQLMEFGLTQEAVAKVVGRSRSAIANSLRLLALPAEMQLALAQGVISAGHGRAILSHDAADRGWVFQQIIERGLTVRQAEALKKADAGTRRSVQESRYVQLEEDLSRHAGTRVRVAGGKRGRIELHFHSEDELTRLLELLGYQA